MESSRRWKNRLRRILLLWIVLLLFAGLLLKSQKIIAHCLNSDSLYLTTVYQDLFVDGNPLKEWVLSPSPCFFPDMVFYFPLLACVPDYGYGLTLYGFVYIGTLFLLLVGLAHSLDVPLYRAVFYVAFALLLWVTVLQDTQRFWLDEYLFVAGRHSGTLLSGLALLWIALRIYRRGLSVGLTLVFFLISVLAVFSDVLILTQFLLPILVVFGLDAYGRRKSYRRFGILTAVVMGAWLLSHLCTSLLNGVHPYPIPKIDWQNNFGFHEFLRSLNAFGRDMVLFFIHTQPFFLTFLLAWMVLGCWFLFVAIRRERLFSFPDTPWAGLGFLYGFSVFSILCALSAPVVTCIWFSMAEIRYIIPLFILPLILVTFSVLLREREIPPEIKGMAMGIILFFATIRIVPGVLSLRMDDFRLPYPDNVRFVDDVIREYHLQYGYCDYWNGNYLRMLSHIPARVNQLHEVLWPYLWINSRQWYWIPGEKGNVHYPIYDFIIVDRLNTDRIVKKLGSPVQVCSFKSDRMHPNSDTEHDETEIYIYNRRSDFAFRNFIRFFFLGEEYPDRTFWPVSPHDLQVHKEDGDAWDREGNTIIAAGERLDVNFARAASGDMLEISVDSGDTYELAFYGWNGDQIQDQPMSDPFVISPVSGEGLRVRYLPLPEACIGKEIARVTVKPTEGDGHYSVGHLWIYFDSEGYTTHHYETGIP